MAAFPTPLFLAMLVLAAAIASSSAAAGLVPTKGKGEEGRARAVATTTASRLEVEKKEEEGDERRQPKGHYGPQEWQWHRQAKLARRTAPVQQQQQQHLSLVRRGARFPRLGKADKAGHIPYYKRLWELYPDRIPSPGTYFDECVYNYMKFVSLVSLASLPRPPKKQSFPSFILSSPLSTYPSQPILPYF
jgi:hypothetical protein